ncbi:MAG TPA: acyl-CoA reductase, partial [Saprospiraceae bacterium]|nr:acyl-CoA reductase [Saprospiraceae bacterium]
SNFDAVIATGGELASNQFKKYLELKPGLIRSHRNSVGVLTGMETDEDLEALGMDVFSYYGLGCRNVSKIYIPKSFDVRRLPEVFDHRYAYVMDLHRYAHNYDFQLAAMLINRLVFLQGETVLLRPSGKLYANIATLNYEYYDDLEGLCRDLSAQEDHIQVVSVNVEIDFPRTCRLGEAQWPELHDYQDGIDVIRFLRQLQID